MSFDFYLFQKLNQFVGISPYLDKVAIFFAEYLQYFVVFCLLLFLVKNLRRNLEMVIFAFAAAIFSRFIITEIIRYFFPRIRPFVENSVNLLIGYNTTESSFPSGHAAFFFALSMVVYFYNKKAGILFFIASFLISISRVFSGIHWPSDILVGAIVGIFSGWIILKISKKFIK